MSSKILKVWKYQTLLTCLSRITFHPPSSIQFSLPPDCHLMICNDCGLAAGSCRVQNILSLSNNGNIIQQRPSAVTCAVLRWDCLDSLKLEVEQCPSYLPPPPHLFVIDKSCWTVWTFNCVLGWCWSSLTVVHISIEIIKTSANFSHNSPQTWSSLWWEASQLLV